MSSDSEEEEEEDSEQPPRKMRAQGKVRNAREAKNIMIQEQLLADIDEEVDLSIQGDHEYRDDELPKPWNRSVIQPRIEQYAIESRLSENLGTNIDWDCDQIRALIKRFVSVGPIIALEGKAPPSDRTFEWTLHGGLAPGFRRGVTS